MEILKDFPEFFGPPAPQIYNFASKASMAEAVTLKDSTAEMRQLLDPTKTGWWFEHNLQYSDIYMYTYIYIYTCQYITHTHNVIIHKYMYICKL